jgi:hypothetical protein
MNSGGIDRRKLVGKTVFLNANMIGIEQAICSDEHGRECASISGAWNKAKSLRRR